MKTIAILGGGFCGTVTAVNLARLSYDPLRIVVVNYRYPLGRGIAYSTKRPEHLLNVVARNMSALADDLSHFLEWLRTRHEFADVPDSQLRELFVSRRVYGDYLLALLRAHSRPARNRSGSTIETLDVEAVQIISNAAGALVKLVDGRTIDAEKILLATGNPPPSEVCIGNIPFQHPNYLNAWEPSEQQLADRSQDVILLGTGLTMVDAYLTLAALDWQGRIVAVSRNGLLPQSHFQGVEYADFPPPDSAAISLAALEAQIEEHCRLRRRRGINPALLVDNLRPYTQLIWRHFSVDERRSFLARHRTRWNIHRHRIAQVVHRVLTQAVDQGRLRIEQGKICELHAAGDDIQVALEDSRGNSRTLQGKIVMNCMGPQERFSTIRSTLLQTLLREGSIAVDELDMGVRVTADFAIIDREGRPSNALYAIGPLLKGTLWETTAVPELRVQSYQVAHILAGVPLRLDRPDPTWPAQPGVELLEYCI